MTSGAPSPASAAVLNLFCASAKGTDWYLILTFGYFLLKRLMRSLKTGASVVGSEVSHHVSSALSVAGSTSAWLFDDESLPLVPLPPQAVRARARAPAAAVMPGNERRMACSLERWRRVNP